MAESVRVPVNEKVVNWAVEYGQMDYDVFESKHKSIYAWITKQAKKPPTLNQVRDFARATSVILPALLENEPPTIEKPIPDFRTIGSKDVIFSRELRDQVDILQQRQGWMSEYLKSHGADVVGLSGFLAGCEVNSNEVAGAIRDKLGIKNKAWALEFNNTAKAFKYLRRHVEDAGVNVVISSIVKNASKRDLKIEEFRGFVLADEYAPFVFINGKDFPSARMFTLLHELAHLSVGDSGVFDNGDTISVRDTEKESFSNKVAAEFLLPKELFISTYEEMRNRFDVGETMKKCSKAYKVSEIACAYRARYFDLITDKQLKEFQLGYTQRVEDFLKNKTGSASGGNPYLNYENRLGKLFVDTVTGALNNVEIPITQGYELTGLTNSSTFFNFLDKRRAFYE